VPLRIRGRRYQRPVIWHLPEQRVVFVHVPKVATRSIRAALGLSATGGVLAQTPEAIREQDRSWAQRFGSYARPSTIRTLGRDNFVFSFVRDPLDRLYSAYNSKLREIARDHRLPIDIDFPRFVERVAALDESCNRHVRSQYRFLTDGDDLLVHHLGRFERLVEDWEVVRAHGGLQSLPHVNPSKAGGHREQYTRELAKIAARRYERDIEEFGYVDAVAELTG
jgi:dermatan 4-sulfotransferase 1